MPDTWSPVEVCDEMVFDLRIEDGIVLFAKEDEAVFIKEKEAVQLIRFEVNKVVRRILWKA